MMPMGGPDDATQELPALPPLEDQGTDNMICSIPSQDTVNLEKAQATLAIQQNGHSPTVQIEGADVHSYRGQWVSMSDDLGFGSQAATGKALSKPDQNAFKVGQGAADQVQSASVNHTDVTTKPKRKRGRPPVKPELSAEERRQIRLKKNRIAAQKSYRKRMAKNQLKKLEHEELEAAHKEAQAELSKARQRLSDICSFLERRGLLAEAEKEGLVVPSAPAKAPPQLHVSAGSQSQSYDIC